MYGRDDTIGLAILLLDALAGAVLGAYLAWEHPWWVIMLAIMIGANVAVILFALAKYLLTSDKD